MGIDVFSQIYVFCENILFFSVSKIDGVITYAIIRRFLDNIQKSMWKFLYQLASPQRFYSLAKKLAWVFGIIAIVSFSYGLIGGLFLAPPDYQQGEAFRIIYIHVPAAFMSLGVYVYLAFCAILLLVWRIKVAGIMIKASAPLGAWFTALALITGSLWGKPMWGTYWIWDARLTSELIQLFLYLGILALLSAIPHKLKAMQASSILILVGIVNVPIIHFSVQWWNTLHQGATLSKFSTPSIAPSMLYPLLAMILAFGAYFITVALLRARAEILEHEQQAKWVQDYVNQ